MSPVRRATPPSPSPPEWPPACRRASCGSTGPRHPHHAVTRGGRQVGWVSFWGNPPTFRWFYRETEGIDLACLGGCLILTHSKLVRSSAFSDETPFGLLCLVIWD